MEQLLTELRQRLNELAAEKVDVEGPRGVQVANADCEVIHAPRAELRHDVLLGRGAAMGAIGDASFSCGSRAAAAELGGTVTGRSGEGLAGGPHAISRTA
jgi:hypothetical protein